MKTRVPRQYRRNEFKDLIINLVKLFEPRTFVSLGLRNGYVFDDISPLVKTIYAVGNDSRVILRTNVLAHYTSTESFFSFLRQTKPGDEFIDMVLIENHNNGNALLADVEGIAPFVKTGTGLVLIHNTHPVKEELATEDYCGTAWQAAEMIRSFFHNAYEIVTLPGPWAGLSILRKVQIGHHLAWQGRRDRRRNSEAGYQGDVQAVYDTVTLDHSPDLGIKLQGHITANNRVADTKVFIRGKEVTAHEFMQYLFGTYIDKEQDNGTSTGGDLLSTLDVDEKTCDVEGADNLRGDNPDTDPDLGD